MSATITMNPRFWDRLADRYAKKPVPDEAAYQKTLERVRAHLEPTHRVLEIGCGTGTTALGLGTAVREIVATDCSGRMIEIAREKARAGGVDNVRFSTGTLEDLELENGSFDVVTSFNLLHLISDVPATLRRVHEVLAPGGLFISKTPCIGEDGVLVRVVIPLLRILGRAPFVNFVKKDELQRQIAAAGFELIETGLYPAKSHSLFVVGRKAPAV
jgi:2-polyprenyl-3-methyl-5-hydroxy-6-metoxy-1,4-benzoquinol methylase